MITTYNLLRDALAPVEDFILNSESGDSYEVGANRGINIRMDFEYRDDASKREMVMAMFHVLRDDLMDIITNGDLCHPSDVVLRCFDGEIKRGKPLSYIEFPRVTWYREYKPRKDSCEYTVFLKTYVEFK